jgi:hypothetical protein
MPFAIVIMSKPPLKVRERVQLASYLMRKKANVSALEQSESIGQENWE